MALQVGEDPITALLMNLVYGGAESGLVVHERRSITAAARLNAVKNGRGFGMGEGRRP
jgi:hypothetical protein